MFVPTVCMHNLHVRCYPRQGSSLWYSKFSFVQSLKFCMSLWEYHCLSSRYLSFYDVHVGLSMQCPLQSFMLEMCPYCSGLAHSWQRGVIMKRDKRTGRLRSLNTGQTLIYKIPLAVFTCEANTNSGRCVGSQSRDVTILFFYSQKKKWKSWLS